MPASDLFFTPDYPGFADGRALPPRSRLFALEPIGIGTAAAEGMISYIIRLANAHSVSPRRLIREEFTKISPGIGIYRRHGAFFEVDARSINGLHQHSLAFSNAVEKLCGIRNAKGLTLQNLQDLLPANGAGLIASHPRWCPTCYRERFDSHQEIYQPLAWSFDLYRTCSRHKSILLDRCPTCGELQHVIPRIPMLGFCCHCGTSLAREASVIRSEDHVDLWLASAIEEIVAGLPWLSGFATRARFLSQLILAIHSYSGGSQRRFCREVGLSNNAFQYWIPRNPKPSLPQWLAIAYGLNVGPVEFLGKAFAPDTPHHALRKLDRELSPPRIRRLNLTETQRDAIEKELRKQAECGNGIVSVAMIAERHQLTRTYIRRLWPNLYRTIRDAYKAKLKSLAEEKRLRKAVIVREILDRFIDRGIYPSQRTLRAALDKTGISYADPAVRQIHRQRLTIRPLNIR